MGRPRFVTLVGQRIRQFRDARKLSPERLVLRCRDMTVQRLHAIEEGRPVALEVGELFEIGNAIGVPALHLLNVKDGDEAELIELLRCLDRRDLKSLNQAADVVWVGVRAKAKARQARSRAARENRATATTRPPTS